jgi:purine-nucleoside phosphorylase
VDESAGSALETPCALDAAVRRAIAELEQRGVLAPHALFFLGTGVGMLPVHLTSASRLPLARVPGVPTAWQGVVLHTGIMGGAVVWLIEDAAGPPEHGSQPPLGEPPWVRGYPCWLAASAGARICVHTAAGLALPSTDAPPIRPGSLALVRDHINFSGRTPLIGLAESKLGPLFPDTSRLHHPPLRARALARAREIGVPLSEAVAACTPGPALDTPSERAWWARSGAHVAVQSLATPLLACAHAGLSVLSIVAVTDTGEGLENMAGIVREAHKLAPALEELLASLAPHLREAAEALGTDA